MEHLRDAIRDAEAMRAAPWAARARCDLARVRLRRASPGDREACLDLLNGALRAAYAGHWQAILEQALALKLEAQGLDTEDATTSIYAVVSAVHREPRDLTEHAAEDGTVTLVFSDIEGFTELTERLGDARAHRVVQAHNSIVRRETRAHGGHEVELRGDGFLLAFASARQALRCAIAIQQSLDAMRRSETPVPIRVRIGIHTGEAIRDADKFFGKTVIQAFRIADAARGGEILVSATTRDLVAGPDAPRFDDGRCVALKGLSGEHRIFAALWA